MISLVMNILLFVTAYTSTGGAIHISKSCAIQSHMSQDGHGGGPSVGAKELELHIRPQ